MRTSITRLSRSKLINEANRRVADARRLFPGTAVEAAASAAEAATQALISAMNEGSDQRLNLHDEVQAALAGEDQLDRRAGGLERCLEAMSDLSVAGAAEVHDLLFPETLTTLLGPRGQAQVAGYALLAERLQTHAAHPGLARLSAEAAALATDLRAFASLLDTKAGEHDARRDHIGAARSARATLESALLDLHWAVHVAAGGPAAAAARGW